MLIYLGLCSKSVEDGPACDLLLFSGLLGFLPSRNLGQYEGFPVLRVGSRGDAPPRHLGFFSLFCEYYYDPSARNSFTTPPRDRSFFPPYFLPPVLFQASRLYEMGVIGPRPICFMDPTHYCARAYRSSSPLFQPSSPHPLSIPPAMGLLCHTEILEASS